MSDVEVREEGLDGTQPPPAPLPSTIAGLPITKVSEDLELLKAMIFGDPGSGKTRLAGSTWEVESMRPILFVDMEGGTTTIRRLWPEIERVRVKDQYNKQGKLVRSGWVQLIDLKEDLRKPIHGFKTVILDNTSEMYDIGMQHWLREDFIARPHRDPDIPAERDYKKVRAMMGKMLRAYRDIPMHVIFTAHRQAVYIGSGENQVLQAYTPALPGKLAYEVSGFVDELFFIEPMPLSSSDKKDPTKNTEIPRRVLCHPINRYLCKDRSQRLPLMVEEVTMAKLASVILDKGGG